ncbi:DUF2946 family protein [Maricaulis maris]|uniref:DUF2946 family protein n=1 Tax=Maricaulis maris TaxID=74318 RepID=UPI003B8B4B31
MMSDLRHMRGLLAPWLFALAMIAVLQQSAIPRGYMLDRGNDGQLAVVLCTAQGSITRWLDLESGDLTETPGADASGNTAQHCAFGAAVALAALPQTTSLPPRITRPDSAAGPYLAQKAPARAHALPPVRGPPATL